MITLCLYHNWLQQEQMYSGPLKTLAWNFLINELSYIHVMVGLYTFFSFWYWCRFASLSCLSSADSFAIFSFWYWRWFNSLFSLHYADSFAIFCLWYWDWVSSLFFLDSEDSFAHFFSLFRRCWASLFSLDSTLSFTLICFSYSCLAINRFSFSSGVSV